MHISAKGLILLVYRGAGRGGTPNSPLLSWGHTRLPPEWSRGLTSHLRRYLGFTHGVLVDSSNQFRIGKSEVSLQ